jgi:DNA-binding GntR family transcriptional regulator
MPGVQPEPGRASLTEDVYGRLRSALLAGRYLPGQKLKISQLCEEVQGSLGAVREALSRLVAEDLVLAEPYRGFFVAPVSRADLSELTAARIEIEKLCLASSLANGDLQWEGELLALLHQLTRSDAERTTDPDRWAKLHGAFHEALVARCDNRWLLRMHRYLQEQSERYSRLALGVGAGLRERGPSRPKRNTIVEHEAIVQAAIARDAERAGELMAKHLQRTTDDLLVALTDEAISAIAPAEAAPAPALRRA